MDDTMSDGTETPNTDLLLQPFGDKPDAGPMVRCVNGPAARLSRGRVGDKHLAVRQTDPIDQPACYRHGGIPGSKQSKLDAGRSAVDRENERARFLSIHLVSHLDSALQGDLSDASSTEPVPSHVGRVKRGCEPEIIPSIRLANEHRLFFRRPRGTLIIS